MKKLLPLLMAALIMLTACEIKNNVNIGTQNNQSSAYLRALSLLSLDSTVLSAQTDETRSGLNSAVFVTPMLIKDVSDALHNASEQLIKQTSHSAPANGGELILYLGEERQTSVHLFANKDKNETIIWVSEIAQSTQYVTDLSLYNSIKNYLSAALVTNNELLEGIYLVASCPKNRDIAKGFALENGVLAAAYNGYNGNGYVDFYNIENGDLLKTIDMPDKIQRLDTGFNQKARVFCNSSVYYLDMKKHETSTVISFAQHNMDDGDSFDINEKLGLVAFASNGKIFTIGGDDENAELKMDEVDVRRSLAPSLQKTLDEESAQIYYKNPRFLKELLCATAVSTLPSIPNIALSSLKVAAKANELQQESKLTSKALQDKQLTSEITHYPGVFGSMGALVGYEENLAVIRGDSAVIFVDLMASEEWQFKISANESVINVPKLLLCEQLTEQINGGIASHVYISLMEGMAGKQLVLKADNTQIIVDGAVLGTLIVRQPSASKLLFIPVPSFGEDVKIT